MTGSEKLLPEFDEEFANTRKILALIPDDRLTWKPHEKSMELGRLAWHLADFPEWTVSILSHTRFAMTEEDAKAYNAWPGKTRAEILAKFDASLPRARALLAAATEADLDTRWQMEWAGQIVIDDPRSLVYRKWTLSHMVHHRAQLGVYLRLLGIPIPGCYGPSADEAVAEPVAAD